MSLNIGESTIIAPDSQWNTLGPGGTINNNQRYDYRPTTNNHYDHSRGNTTNNSTNRTTYNGSNHYSGGNINHAAPVSSNPQSPLTGQGLAPIPGAFAYPQQPTSQPQTAPRSTFNPYPPPPWMSGQSYGYPSTPYGPNPTGHYAQFQSQPQQQFGAAPPPMRYPTNGPSTAGQYPYNQHPYYAQPIPPASTSTSTTPPSTHQTSPQPTAPQSPPVEEDSGTSI